MFLKAGVWYIFRKACWGQPDSVEMKTGKEKELFKESEDPFTISEETGWMSFEKWTGYDDVKGGWQSFIAAGACWAINHTMLPHVGGTEIES